MQRRGFLLATLAAAACGRRDSSALARAVRWLWSQQSDDGGWHSKTYGLLRSGQSLTPFVLDALLSASSPLVLNQLVSGPRQASAVDRGFDFLKRNTNSDGSLGLSDSAGPDYPNYATGLAVRVAARLKRDASPWIACLRAQQFTEVNGWAPSDPAYGAWGMGGERRRPPEAGHVDLAMTRYVLEGLAAAGIPPADPVMQKALVYVKRCQNPDGGFFFSTVNLDTNKAGDVSGKYRSYGTTTCDGLLAMRAAGVPESDTRIARAQAWLKQNHLEERAPGFDIEPARMGWSDGLRFYYAAAITRAMPDLSVILPPQRDDGSFANRNNLVKEDDPLIATAFAVRVLCQDRGG
ncbi:MAG TPA: prenyltransferase/squalene oxidase repeat-containing protein [Bryobacteraceae bacterium]|nr:prenyltransferase/squalene oxidase repeat-containing protein [Bryobacteraceae bacterium]